MSEVRSEMGQASRLLAGTAGTALLGVAYGIFATRRLDAAAVAAFTHALSIIALLQIGLGPINATVARFSAEFAASGRLGMVRSLVREVNRRAARYCLLALIPVLLAAVPLSRFWKYDSPVPLQVALLTVGATVFLNVVRGTLRGLQLFGAFNVSTVSEAAIRLLSGVALLSFWVNATAGLLPYLLAVIVALLLSASRLRDAWGEAEPLPVDGGAVRRFAAPMVLLMSTSAALQNLDMLIVKRLFETGDAAVYGIAFYLSGRVMAVLVAPFNTLILPLVASRAGTGRQPRSTVVRVAAVFVVVAAVPLAIIGLWPRETMQLLYADRFAEAASLLLPLAIARLMGSLSHLLALARAASGRFGFLAIFCTGVIGEIVALAIWHQTPAVVARVVLVSQAIVLVLLVLESMSGAGRRAARAGAA